MAKHTTRRRSPAKPRRVSRPQYPDLATYIDKSGDTQARISVRVGTSQAHISRIAKGDAIPRSLLALRIATYANIPLDSFTRVYLAKRTLATGV